MIDEGLHILLVEDDGAHAGLIRRAFQTRAPRVRLTTTYTLADARRQLAEATVDLVIVDLLMPDGHGTELLPPEGERPRLPTIVMTSFGSEQAAAEAIKAGALDYVVKSETTLADMPHIAQQALRQWRGIVARREAEEALRESEERYRRLVELSPDAVVILQGEKLQFVNSAFTQLFGYTRRDVKEGLRYLDLVHQDSKESASRRYQDRLAGKPLATTFTYDLITKDGTVVPCETSGALIQYQGRPADLISIRDVTERRRHEKALAQAKEAAEAANRAKSEFLANMSHEIRTPMTAIMGFADLMMSYEMVPSERRENLKTIHRNAENLLTIINDILDLSKIEADKIEIERIDCPTRKIVEEVRSLMRVRANEKNLSLDVLYRFPLPETVRTDPLRLRQILVNLVGNAVKFTESGGVRIVVRCVGGQNAPPRIQFAVADTGIGMTDDQIDRLFHPFTQADSSSTRRFGGTGLGLSISRRLARMLGGDVEAQSEFGEGSTFTLTIDPGPLQRVAMVDAFPPALAAMAQRGRVPAGNIPTDGALSGRVLLVEDEVDVQRLMALVLTQWGLDVDRADDGRAAYAQAAESLAEDNPYDLILMDIQLPELDGYEVTRMLRRDGFDGPILALTAHAMTGDREKCLDCGCDDYLAKPVSPAGLFATVARCLGQTAAGSDAAAAANPGLMGSTAISDADKAEMLAEFIGQLPERTESIEAALKANDLESLTHHSHRLKGAAAIYGLPRISDAADAVYRLATGSADNGRLPAVVAELLGLCETASEDDCLVGSARASRPEPEAAAD